MTFDRNTKKVLFLIACAAAVRLILATQVELGNDEVYYWTYVRYPDLSHFDHPLMVGLLGQLCSLNLLIPGATVLRLGSILLSAGSTWLIFRIGRNIGNTRAGLFAALLFTGSLYCSIIGGMFFTPDAPLVFFWLLSLDVLIGALPSQPITRSGRIKMLWFGAAAGLAMLSKYQGLFLWVGAVLFILLCRRSWLKEYSLYAAGLVSCLVLSPLLIWNARHHFVSFLFHAERVAPSVQIHPGYFLMNILGQIVYNNPIVYVLTIIAAGAFLAKRKFVVPDTARLLLLTGIPLWVLITAISLFRFTLPHWTSPAFIPLIILAGVYWSEKRESMDGVSFWISTPLYLLSAMVIIALYLVNYSPLQLGKTADVLEFGTNDYTQDLSGWQEIGTAFKTIADREEKSGRMPLNSDIVSYRWFPGAHLDYYTAYPLHRNVFLIGPLTDLHEYARINELRGGLIPGNDYYHIAVSNYYRDPEALLGRYFEKIEPIDTVEIRRAGTIMRYAFFYRLKNYNGTFAGPPSDQ